MKKADRELIKNKFGGKCAYCGDPLKKGWHVDELLPVIRKRKWIKQGFFHIVTGGELPPLTSGYDNPDYEWRDGKWIADGMEHPERLVLSNQMPSCPSCNINKHSNSLEGFREFITHFIVSLNRDSTQYKMAKKYGLIQETGKPVVFYFETFK